jgi:hypothetical protein
VPRDSALRVVSGDETVRPAPRRRRSRSVKNAASKSRRDLLTALRDKIAADIDDGVPARDLASLSKRLLDISRELDDLITAEEGDDVSEAAATPDEPWSG